jgi:hypothetical protein
MAAETARLVAHRDCPRCGSEGRARRFGGSASDYQHGSLKADVAAAKAAGEGASS